MSKLYMDGINELRLGRAREIFGKGSEAIIDRSAREYLNQASKLLDLEEQGEFRFWEPGQLKKLVLRAGLKPSNVRTSLGDPPQAIIISGARW